MTLRSPRVTFFHNTARQGHAPKLLYDNVSEDELKIQLLLFFAQENNIDLRKGVPDELSENTSIRIDNVEKLLLAFKLVDLSSPIAEPTKYQNSRRNLPVELIRNLLWHYIEASKVDDYSRIGYTANIKTKLKKKSIDPREQNIKLSTSMIKWITEVFLNGQDGWLTKQSNFMTVQNACERTSDILNLLGIKSFSWEAIKKILYKNGRYSPVFFKKSQNIRVKYVAAPKDRKTRVGKYDRSKPRSTRHVVK